MKKYIIPAVEIQCAEVEESMLVNLSPNPTNTGIDVVDQDATPNQPGNVRQEAEWDMWED